jgi:S-formylglutathione hydrolase FrmB
MRIPPIVAPALALFALAHPSLAEVRRDSFRSPSLGEDVALAVQLPPSYATAQADYPVVYALHGLFESEGFWARRGLAAQLDELWAAKKLPEFVLVAVDGGNSFFVNGPLGRYEDLLQDTATWAEANLRVRRERAGRALWGVSMGGYAALRIALRRPERFGAVVTHSAMLLEHPPSRREGAGRWHMEAFHRAFGDPIDARLWGDNDPLALAAKASPAALPALRFDCGAQDRYGLHAGNRKLHEILDARGLAHEFELPPGDHGYDYVKSVFERGLRFLSARWRDK